MKPHRRLFILILTFLSGYILGARIFSMSFTFIESVLPYWFPNDGSVEVEYIKSRRGQFNHDLTEAQKLINHIKILCWGLGNRDKFQHVVSTWGRKCSKIIYLDEQKGNF